MPVDPSKRTRRAARVVVVAIAALASMSVVLAPVDGFSDGRPDRAALGCGDAGCHGVGSAPSSTLVPVLEGLPEKYTPGDTFVLTVRMEGGADPLPAPVRQHAGGFALGATDGALSVPPGAGDVQVDDASGNATHTKAGATQRAWSVVWTAPPPTAGTVTFDLAVLAVNGNAAPDPLDEWALLTVTTMEDALPLEPPGPAVNATDDVLIPERDSRLPATPAPVVGVAVAAAALASAFVRRRARDGDEENK